MSDYDITANYHRGDPLSSEAHRKSGASRAKQRDRIERYLEARPRGASPAEAERDLGIRHQSCSSRFSELPWMHQTAFRISVLHGFGLYLDIEEKRPVPGSKGNSEVFMAKQQIIDSYGRGLMPHIIKASQKESRAKGTKPPIDRMSDTLWRVYDFVDGCGRKGSIADTAEHRLGLTHGNNSNRFKDLNTCKAFVKISDLRKLGVFLDISPRRQTRQSQSAAVRVTIGTVLDEGIGKERLDQLLSAAEWSHLDRLLRR